MLNASLPFVLERILESEAAPIAIFHELLPILGEVLHCDRIFLYLRHPETRRGTTACCWRRTSEFPDTTNIRWEQEPESLTSEDPMFAAAVAGKNSIFVEDVETADPTVLNRDFERKNFGHRALIHGHLVQDGQLWGVLQPCVFGKPRIWSDFDRSVIQQLIPKLTPLAIAFVQQNHPSHLCIE